MIYDFAIQDRLPFSKWPVDGSPEALVRCLVIAGAACLLVRAIRPEGFSGTGQAFWGGVGQLRVASVFATAFIAATAAVLLIDPALLERFGREDSLIENLSAIFLFVAALATWSAMRHTPVHVDILGIAIRARWLLAGLGALFLLICLEEISWGQRILGFASPDIFSRNQQGQTNLHNFATWTAEQIYYGVAFFGFVLFPYAASRAASGGPGRADVLTPVPGFALVAAPASFLQSEMWNTVPVQIAAWATAFILVDFAIRTGGMLRCWIVVVLGVCIAGQAVFFFAAEDLVRSHELTEYKESLIALLCLTWALIILRRSRLSSRP